MVPLQRLKLISTIYRLYIKINLSNTSSAPRISFYDFLNGQLFYGYDLNKVLSDFKYVTKNKQILLDDEEMNNQQQRQSDYDNCSAEDCFIMARIERDRSSGNEEKNGQLARLFFIDKDDNGKNKADDGLYDNIVCQEVMDSIHTYLYHTIRLTKQEIEQKKEELKADAHNKGGDEDKDLYDPFSDAVTRIIRKKKGLTQYRRNSNRYSSGNKFVTTSESIDDRAEAKNSSATNDDSSLALYQSAVYGNDQLLMSKQQKQQKAQSKIRDVLMMDELIEEIQRQSPNDTAVFVDALIQYLTGEEFDSDGLVIDFENQHQSNVLSTLKEITPDKHNLIDLVYSIGHRFSYKARVHDYEYSEGIRFWYWPYYKNIEEEENIVWEETSGAHRCESNPGYKIKDWFIPAVWNNLKEEALFNEICAFAIQSYNMTLNKAKLKLNEWKTDPEARQLVCIDICNLYRAYGVAIGDEANISHILSLLFYTNFTQHCYEFSKTFRRAYAFESDRKLKQRHAQVANWSRHLRELVECFGEETNKCPEISKFYHGVSTEMIFKGTVTRLCGPLSTTLGISPF